MKQYSSKQFKEQIILVTKGWGLSENQLDKYNKIEKIRKILIEMIRVSFIYDASLYYWIYTITKEYILEYRFNNLFQNEIVKVYNNQGSFDLYDIINLMLIELSLLPVSDDLLLEPIDEILNL